MKRTSFFGVLCSQRWRSSIQSAKTRPGADCGSDHERLIAKFRLKLNGFYEDLQDFLELTPKKDVLFIIGDWNTKVGSQEIPGVTANLALEYRMKPGKG